MGLNWKRECRGQWGLEFDIRNRDDEVGGPCKVNPSPLLVVGLLSLNRDKSAWRICWFIFCH